jgi:hypothetical protein
MKMEIDHLEFVTDEGLQMLQRESRRINRVNRQSIAELSMEAFFKMKREDLVAFDELVDRLRECELVKWRLQPVAEESEEGHADPEAGVIFDFARGKPWLSVLVKFKSAPSQAFEDRLRQVAKIRKLPLHFFRLAGDWVAVDVRPELTPQEFDAKFLRDMDIAG